MHYALYLQQGWPIGSGVVEAACKTLVTQRMKQSGMSWGQRGGQAILTLRSLIQSDRWNQAWPLVRTSFSKQVNFVHDKHQLPLPQPLFAHPVAKVEPTNFEYFFSLPLGA
jgi:hypothetical protein